MTLLIDNAICPIPIPINNNIEFCYICLVKYTVACCCNIPCVVQCEKMLLNKFTRQQAFQRSSHDNRVTGTLTAHRCLPMDFTQKFLLEPAEGKTSVLRRRSAAINNLMTDTCHQSPRGDSTSSQMVAAKNKS